ncbi:MAG: hypothetical protein M3Y06_00150 [Actinomycetota bacterium]|nr:hypothetical protein [Actinomycetota bacterium]
MSSTHQVRTRLEPTQGVAREQRWVDAEQMRRALMQLPRRQAQAVGLVYAEHLTQKQVAKRLRVSPKRAGRDLAMALQRLAAILERTEAI